MKGVAEIGLFVTSGSPSRSRFILGTFRFDYEYEIEYEYDLIVRMTMVFFSSELIVATQRTLITITYLTYVTVITQLTILYLDYLQFSSVTAYHTILTYAAYSTTL